jgi:hypothetical protein
MGSTSRGSGSTKSVKAVLYGKPVRCPSCGTELTLGATIRLKGRELGQDKLDDYPEPSTAEADSDG